MNKLFIKVILFFVILAGILLSIVHLDNLDRCQSSNNNIFSLQNKSKYDSLDILFVGNSYCYSGVMPSYFDSVGISTFNLGIATSGVKFYQLIIKDYLKKTAEKPKSIYLLISPMTFSHSADNFEIYPIHRYLEKPISNFQLSYELRDMKKIDGIYRKSFKKGLKNLWSLQFFNELNCYKTGVKLKGFFPSEQIVNQKEIDRTEKLYLPLREDIFPTVAANDLMQLACELKGNDTNVVFFELPTNVLDQYFNGSYLNDYSSFKYELKEKYEVLEVNKQLFSQKDYRNIDHLNLSGAKIATAELHRLMVSEI